LIQIINDILKDTW